MIRRWKNIFSNVFRQLVTRDSFVQNSAYMFSASFFSMLIQFAFFPILSRIYSPEAYGLFGVFNFYCSAVGSCATLSLNQALVLPRTNREFISLLRLCFIVTFIITGTITLVTIFCGHPLMRLTNTESIGWWVYLIGPVGLVMAIDRIMVEWAIREKMFRKVTLWSTINTLFNKILNVCYGKLISPSAGGLVLTNVLVYGVRAGLNGVFVLKNAIPTLAAKVSRQELAATAKQYKNFPKYMFWGNFIDLVSSSLPSVALPAVGLALNTVGYFNYSLLLLDLPIRLLSSGVSSVFLPKATEMHAERVHELGPATWKLFRMMLLVSIVSTGFIFLFGRPLYSFLFGSNWAEAGKAAEILAIYYYFRLASAPLAGLYNVLKKEKEFFAFQMVLFFLRAASLYFGGIYIGSFLGIMILFSAVNAICHLWLCYRIFGMARIDRKKGMLFTLSWSLIVFGGGFLLKNFLFN